MCLTCGCNSAGRAMAHATAHLQPLPAACWKEELALQGNGKVFPALLDTSRYFPQERPRPSTNPSCRMPRLWQTSWCQRLMRTLESSLQALSWAIKFIRHRFLEFFSWAFSNFNISWAHTKYQNCIAAGHSGWWWVSVSLCLGVQHMLHRAAAGSQQ